MGQKLTVNYRDHNYPEACGLEFEETFCVHSIAAGFLPRYAPTQKMLHRFGTMSFFYLLPWLTLQALPLQVRKANNAIESFVPIP